MRASLPLPSKPHNPPTLSASSSMYNPIHISYLEYRHLPSGHLPSGQSKIWTVARWSIENMDSSPAAIVFIIKYNKIMKCNKILKCNK